MTDRDLECLDELVKANNINLNGSNYEVKVIKNVYIN